MTYYNSKHPGLLTYLILMTISVISFLFFDVTAFEIGILSILWSGFVLARSLSFFEIYTAEKSFDGVQGISKTKQSSALPYDLGRRMERRKNLRHGMFAMDALHERTMLLLALAFIYGTYLFFFLDHTNTLTIFIKNFSVFFIIGAAFWAGQTYAYSNSASKLMMLICFALFTLATYETTKNFSLDWHTVILTNFINHYDNSALPLLLALIVYSIATLIYACTHGAQYRKNAMMGLVILTLLILFGFSLEPNINVTAFWLSGLGVFSIFWIRSYRHSSRRYILYQCE